MAQFHLHISADGHEEHDDDGHVFKDLRHAIAEAGKTAGELLYDALRTDLRTTRVRVRVCGPDGHEHAVISAECRLSEHD